MSTASTDEAPSTIWTGAAGTSSVLEQLDMTAPPPDRATAARLVAEVKARIERKLRAYMPRPVAYYPRKRIR